MLFNDINFSSISPLKSILNKTTFKTPQNKLQAYVSNPEISRIKETFYQRTGRNKRNCDDSRYEAAQRIQTPTNTSKFSKENNNDKYEMKMKSIIERRMNLQQSNYKSRCTSKTVTPNKKETKEKKIDFSPILQEKIENYSKLQRKFEGIEEKEKNEDLIVKNQRRFEEKEEVFMKNQKKFEEYEEKEEIFMKNQRKFEEKKAFNSNFETKVHNKFEEALSRTKKTLNENSFNKLNPSILSDISNSLIIKETKNDEEKFKGNLMMRFEEINMNTNSQSQDSENFDYNYKLLKKNHSNKKNNENHSNQKNNENNKNKKNSSNDSNDSNNQKHDENSLEITKQIYIENSSQITKEIYSDGSIYYGSKLHNLKHGKGIYIDISQRFYAGEFKDGKKEGSGTLKAQNGEIIYEGEWKSNKYHGKGILNNFNKKNSNKLFNYRNMDSIEENWFKYQGEFLNGLYNGLGVLTIGNGKVYQGEFKQGYVHGHGVIFCELNRENKIEGEWRLNIYVSSLI